MYSNPIPTRKSTCIYTRVTITVISNTNTFVSPGQCPMGFFGDLCQYSCHCEFGAACSFTTGECFAGCDDGWTGKPTCQIGMVYHVPEFVKKNMYLSISHVLLLSICHSPSFSVIYNRGFSLNITREFGRNPSLFYNKVFNCIRLLDKKRLWCVPNIRIKKSEFGIF